MSLLALVAVATALGAVAILLLARAPAPAAPAGAAEAREDRADLAWARAAGAAGLERLLLRLFEAMGFEPGDPSRGEHDVEFLAVDPAPIRGGRVYVLGVTGAAGLAVGADEVRAALDAARGELCGKAVLVTLDRFTTEAREAAREQPIDLVDGETLAALLRRHLPQAWATRTA